MKFLHLNRLFVCLIFVFFAQFVEAQNAISEKITQNLSHIQSTELYTPLKATTADELKSRIADNVLSRKQFLQIQNQTVQTIKNNDSEHLRIMIPIVGEDTELQLIKAEIFTDDFRAVATSNPNARLDIDTGTHYRGTVKDVEKSLAVISFFDNEITGLIQLGDMQYTLGKVPDSDKHILYKNSDLNFTPDFSCEAIPVGEGVSINEVTPVEKAIMGCVRIHVEADYSLYQNQGASIVATTNYINGVFAEVTTMYANESISLQVNFLRVWDTPSPYNSDTELDDLTTQAYGRTSGDLVHLVHNNAPGGVAYQDVLCTAALNTGVSGVFGSYNNVPTYSEDVAVITHELGHNLGSPHTHDCVWNGNNTQIDDCGSKYFDEDTDPDTEAEPCYNGNSEILPASGTIMSYCHLLDGVGVDFNLGFATEPGDLIRSRVNAATCLTACGPPTCSDGFQNGDEEGIDCGGASCPVCPTCDDGIENGDETGVDCGGASCLPCPCGMFGNTLSIIIKLDQYPEETTWKIKDGYLVVASGGPYNVPPGTTIVEQACVLVNGCFYDFVVEDLYQDGICCSFGYGSYMLVDGDGNVLASGGEFTDVETTQFCLNNANGWNTCDPVIDFGASTLTNGTAHAQNKVISGGSINSGRNITLKAGQTIHLESGFNVDANADVQILIEDCTTPAVPD